MGSAHSQEVWLVMIPKVSGTIGIVCNLFLMSEIYRDYQAGLINPMKRALFGVTIHELSDTIGWWLSNWALPKDVDFALASGSWASCNFQGFLLQCSIGAPMLNAVLAYLFLLTVKGNYSVKEIVTFETKVYLSICSFTLGGALLFLGLGQYNPYGQICWLNGYPSGCNEAVWGGSDIPCERGINSHIYGVFVYYLVLWSTLIFAIAINVRMHNMLVDANSPSDAQWVKSQSVLYCFAFIITWTPSTLWSIMMWFNLGGFPIGVLTAIFEPLQGFWNLLIFCRNRPNTLKRIRRYFCLDNNTTHPSSTIVTEEKFEASVPVSESVKEQYVEGNMIGKSTGIN